MDQNNKKKIKLEDLPDLLTVREVSDLLRVSPLTIKRWGNVGSFQLSASTPVVTAATKRKQFYGFLECRPRKNRLHKSTNLQINKSTN